MKLHVNNSEVIALTNKLEQLNRSAFPVAVRTALNSAAFGVINKSVRQYTDGTVSVKLSGITSSSITVTGPTGSGVQIASGLPDGHLVFINANMTKTPDVTPVSSFFQTDGVIGLYENIGSGLSWSLSFTYKKS